MQFDENNKLIKTFNSMPPLVRPSAIVLLKTGDFAVKGNNHIALFNEKCQQISVLAGSQLKRPFGKI